MGASAHKIFARTALVMLLVHGAVTCLVILAVVYLNPQSRNLAFLMRGLIIFSAIALWAFAGAAELILNKTVYLGCSLAGFFTFIVIVGTLSHGTVRVETAHPILTYLRYFYGLLSLALWIPLVGFLISNKHEGNGEGQR